jgi:2-polyprenyl-3-methyl-5-hydroxy-6-metoxy-1,4-benzoquinol methylase
VATATDRVANEQAFHDSQANERAAHFRCHPDQLIFSDDAYLDHETWIRPAFRKLGNIRGRRVLDFGCGHGMAAVTMARLGAYVTAFDLSNGYVAEAISRARANRVEASFVVADAHQLPFPDQSFDRIWGCAILHHLDLAIAAPEIKRILRPNGIAVFSEPWDGNRLLQWARQRLAYPEKERTADEQPLGAAHLRQLESVFSRVEIQGHQLLSMIRRLTGPTPLTAGLTRLDDCLLSGVPGLWRFCRYLVLTCHR